MVYATNLGYPRIGPNRELKKALESHWDGKIAEAELQRIAASLRKANWQLQKDLGLDQIPSSDFSLYDHVLDTAAMVGAVPARYQQSGSSIDLSTYFAMARGRQEVPAMEMTKWFDTNYHYIVPEFEKGQTFQLASTKPLDDFREAKALGIHTRPVLVGPISFLLLGKPKQEDVSPLSLLDSILPVYQDVLSRLAEAGADWIQMDEPCLVLDQSDEVRALLTRTYTALTESSKGLRILLASYFGDMRENLATALRLPVAALHLDLVRAPQQLTRALENGTATSLSLGIVDGRNVWKTDLNATLSMLDAAVNQLGADRVLIGPSCSLLHTPVDLDRETKMDAELCDWLAFAKQKVQEIVLLTRALKEGRKTVEQQLQANQESIQHRRTSPRIHNQQILQRAGSVSDEMLRRKNPYIARKEQQRKRLGIPAFPTTTIGSFPQTQEVRHVRAEFKSGKKNAEQYEDFLKSEIEKTIRFQEEIGLDVLVHGEFERTDMVEYFAERLSGFAFTQNAWVQSYGSRCVRPPIIFGDVGRTNPMTVKWSQFAQSLTSRPVKGMLTGPVTILQWSFVRDDQPRSETCKQIALAIRDEVLDLEKAGIKVIQIDEPALREGLPLRQDDRPQYLKWAINSFRLASAGVRDETQIHTHMCYSEFNDMIESIAAMDADVIAIEASRSQMELLDAFVKFRYPSEIGPGVYDIHSPRVPDRQEMEKLLRKALEVLSQDQLWVNPDCGLKTRKWEEVRPALTNLVAAARRLRGPA